MQNVELAKERVWAHAIERPEAGAVLLASLRAPTLLNDARMWQVGAPPLQINTDLLGEAHCLFLYM